MDVDNNDSEMCLIAYERERLRIIDLCYVLLNGQSEAELVKNIDNLE